jgi:Ran GTPase-activating protein (RanGAP) involved in mRNA processing and transport
VPVFGNNICHALFHLAASKRAGKQSRVFHQNMKLAVNRIESTAGETGLNEAAIEALVDAAGCGKLGEWLMR